MKTIWKFPVTIGDVISIKLPRFSEVLTVQSQFGEPVIWAIVEPDNPIEVRQFEIFGTGHPIKDLPDTIQRKYINTFQVSGGALVFHVFELSHIFIPTYIDPQW